MNTQQIEEVVAAFTNAWNRHDIPAMLDCFVPTGNITHPWGTFAVGREAMAELLESEHSGTMRLSQCTVVETNVRSLSDKTAVIECEAVIDNVLAPNGSTYTLRGCLNSVVVEDGGYRFLSMHPTVHARR